MENILLDVMYDLPSMQNVSKVVIDDAVVRGEAKPFIVYESNDAGSSGAKSTAA